ncbi:hypothetical protein DQ04_05341000 [Trypanosoma grayi]|uniref:hypothetical protein n=1 Tax=Trypanosoma grayi TaxID=71804 RepID=UPI0004F40159|nr:hypothetical protein DQ04_05341000 [Trypanosoma grayi]KEG09364.1 hypothetical protein DQ04_05341000 [Trypanosoma grayi]
MVGGCGCDIGNAGARNVHMEQKHPNGLDKAAQKPDRAIPRTPREEKEKEEVPASHAAAIKQKESDEALPQRPKSKREDTSLTTEAPTKHEVKGPLPLEQRRGKTPYIMLETFRPQKLSHVTLQKISWGKKGTHTNGKRRTPREYPPVANCLPLTLYVGRAGMQRHSKRGPIKRRMV